MTELRGLGGCLLAAGLLALCAAPAHGAPTGTLRLAGWFDTNRDGVHDEDEPTLTDYTGLRIRSLDGGADPVVPGPDTSELTVRPGEYEVSTSDYASSTESPLRVSVPKDGEATAELGLYGRTVRGGAWTDENIDGIRQPDEVARPGVRITAPNVETITDPDGNYQLDNVAFDAPVSAPAAGTSGPLLPSPPDQVAGTFGPEDPDVADDSDFQADGNTAVLAGSADVADIDLGVAPGAFDQKVELSTDRDTEALKVGNEVIATFTLRGWNGLPAQREADIAIPAGLSFVRADGGGFPVELSPDQTLATIRPDQPQPIGTFHLVKVRFRVTEVPQAPGELAIRLNGRDTNPANDEASQPVNIT